MLLNITMEENEFPNSDLLNSRPTPWYLLMQKSLLYTQLWFDLFCVYFRSDFLLSYNKASFYILSTSGNAEALFAHVNQGESIIYSAISLMYYIICYTAILCSLWIKDTCFLCNSLAIQNSCTF